ncbi:MBL fold metallo-hydrolase [Clostridium boliviensis]|uniref:MBL fold metallo-hydrolase n=1 Tax=Clostridium boliviensis TaxID=318465 RepID=A0ABU4GUM0_9CLOT|nr:MBL fold metallo-hydrolase [Clostridium boliviensis]MDW2800692.1 MBL fold metallo-hydrolase [Clostridium boliviensis]
MISSLNVYVTDTASFFAHFIKVGDADSIILEQNGKYILVDTGRYSDAGTVKAVIQEKQISHLDSVIITHYDSDHMGGINEIIQSIDYNVDTVYARFYDLTVLERLKRYQDDTNTQKTSVYRNYVNFVNTMISLKNGTKTFNFTSTDSPNTIYAAATDIYQNGGNWISPNRSRGNTKFYFGNTNLVFKNRVGSYLNSSTANDKINGNVNNDSLVFRLTTASDIKMLFLGDLGTTGGKNLASEAGTYPINSDIVKIAHHGYKGSTPENLLAEIAPRYSVITCATSVATERIEALLKVPGKFGRIYFTGSSDFTGDFCTLKIDGSGKIDFDNNFNYYWNDTK